MKLLTLICESMLIGDLPEGHRIPGYIRMEFNPWPARFSCEALWCMQTDQPIKPTPNEFLRHPSWFLDGDFLSKRIRTRIIGDFWPRRYDPTPLDPQSNVSTYGCRRGLDPDCWMWDKLQDALKKDEADWVVYWPLLGHVDYRMPGENNGVPRNLKKTCQRWMQLVDELMAKVDCPCLIHTDHGTARQGQEHWQFMRQGFCYLPETWAMDMPPRLDWSGIRKLQSKAF